MTSVEDLIQSLATAQQSLPFPAAEAYRDELEVIGQQAAAALRTSKDEAAITGVIEHARVHGGTVITAHLDRMSGVIGSASTTW
ncbi:hypothetical protein [Saccharopolyspora spinosa]|uniref:Uncharacterized protein n=1 Tax=Saccharopolyspora spinosa TaxID=60894 RepID=A0A2N3Y6T9_SACSN|nr:hypothetical protein [Saccharopolyspora spinosa]PKW18637.1 hypothetical protein A8926_6747 [Saccharopolyspora spinosa]